MFCRKCGRQLEEGAAFCDGCGTPVRTTPGVMQMQTEVPIEKVTIKRKRKRVVPVMLALLVLAAGAGAFLYVNGGGHRSLETMKLAEDKEQAEKKEQSEKTERPEEKEQAEEKEQPEETEQLEEKEQAEGNEQEEKIDPAEEEALETTEEEAHEEMEEEAIGAEVILFVDVSGQPYEVDKNPLVEEHPYELSAFVREGDKLTYEDETYVSRAGIDVSHHNGDIDWGKVKEQGIEFAMIRLGYRGYGEEGTVNLDKQFENNIINAQNAGIEVGVYFFSQAVNEKEAETEADFVLEHLSGYEISLPVVYDMGSITGVEARTDDVTSEQFTLNTEVFCKKISEAGYAPMIYCDMLREAYRLDLTRLSEYPVWYADYERLPQTPYDFEIWQYTNQGKVDGIQGDVDLDIQLIRK